MRFEYKLFMLSWMGDANGKYIAPSSMDELNVLGQQGWEVVSVNERFAFLKLKIQ